MKYYLLCLAMATAHATPIFAQTATSDATGSTGSSNTATTQRADDSPHHDYGWIGLLGLIGLAGLRKQHHDGVVDTTVGTRR